MSLRVLGVLAGDDVDQGLIELWAASAEVILAADGGVNHLISLGLRPNVVIGDLDSAENEYLEDLTVLHVSSQDSTDCDKLLELARSRSYASITLIGTEGTLPDHSLATLQSCARSDLNIQIAFRRGLGLILRPGQEVVLGSKPGARVSMLPLVESSGACLSGVEWPLIEADIHPLGLTSISNRALGNSVSASLKTGSALLFVEVDRTQVPAWRT